MHRYVRVVRSTRRQAYPNIARRVPGMRQRMGFVLSRILNLIVNMNKHNPMRVECYFETATGKSDETSDDQHSFDGQWNT